MHTAIFAHHYHIRPWEMDLLTAVQFDQLVAAYERYAEESRKT